MCSKVPDNCHPLYGALLKVERAKRHVSEIEREISDFFARSPYEIFTDQDAETGDKRWRVRVKECVPPALSAPLGDAIHNIRSAFDHIACQIVQLGGANISQAYFPVNGKPQSFKAKGLAKIKGAPQHAIAVVERLQPYHGGDNAMLWTIHKLDLLDKHSAIIPVGAAFSHATFYFDPNEFFASIVPGWVRSEKVVTSLAIRPADRLYPLQDGATILIANPPP